MGLLEGRVVMWGEFLGDGLLRCGFHGAASNDGIEGYGVYFLVLSLLTLVACIFFRDLLEEDLLVVVVAAHVCTHVYCPAYLIDGTIGYLSVYDMMEE